MKKVLSALILTLIPLFGFATEFKTVCASRVSLNFSPGFAYKTTPNGNNSSMDFLPCYTWNSIKNKDGSYTTSCAIRTSLTLQTCVLWKSTPGQNGSYSTECSAYTSLDYAKKPCVEYKTTKETSGNLLTTCSSYSNLAYAKEQCTLWKTTER